MANDSINSFELILLVVGLGAGFLGFHLINQVYSTTQSISWLMVIAIFNWLMLLVLFVSLSLSVAISKRQLHEFRRLAEALQKKKKR